ncbi:U3 snoRNP protein [Irineochytrium annulatum]|nr:U3 snoRNP protein [Irineochytrium annulatum]
MCEDINNTFDSVETSRDKQGRLHRLCKHALALSLPADTEEVVVRFLFAMLGTKFAPVRAAVVTCLEHFAAEPLIGLLKSAPHIFQSHSQHILPLFFALFHTETYEVVADTEEQTSSKSNAIIIEFLRVISTVKQPAKLYNGELLYNIELKLLSKNDPKLQHVALGCVIAWKRPGITKYAETLARLVTEDKLREVLSTMDVPAMKESLQEEDERELIDVLVRLLFGKLTTRVGKASKSGAKGRRKAILAFFVSLGDDSRRALFDLMVAPFSKSRESKPRLDSGKDTLPRNELRQFLGFLNLAEDMIVQFRNHLLPLIPDILRILLYIAEAASSFLSVASADIDDVADDERSLLGLHRTLRQLSVRRLSEIFSLELDMSFDPFISDILKIVVNPRLALFEVENTQAPSGVMNLIATWAKSNLYCHYLGTSEDIVPKVLALLSAKNVHPSVVDAVFGVLDSIFSHDVDNMLASPQELIGPHLESLFGHVATFLKLVDEIYPRERRVTATSRAVALLAKSCDFVKSPVNADWVLSILMPYLNKPNRVISETMKADILRIFASLFEYLPSLRDGKPLKSRYFTTISHLFATLESAESRSNLVTLMGCFAKLDKKLEVVIPILADLNAADQKKLNQPDFNKRFDAFNKVSQSLYKELDVDQWLPIISNLLYAMHDEEEYSIRTSATFCLTKYIDVAAGHTPTEVGNDEMYTNIAYVILPAIKRAMASRAENTRQEFLSILGLLVERFPSKVEFSDLTPLLANGDEEANFFKNIYHLQTHRRIRAMHRLQNECKAGKMSSSNIFHIFLPMIAHNIFESDRTTQHNFINEAINTVSSCCGCLPWSRYYSTLNKFLSILSKRPQLERELTRLVVAIVENFDFSMSATATEVSAEATVNDNGVIADHEEEAIVSRPKENSTRIREVVMNKLIPTLFAYLTAENEENLNLRIPIAIAITKLLKRLPYGSLEAHLPKLLTSIAQFLKSKAQDVRDSTRAALVKIALDVGPAYFLFIVRELKGALLRGYQLHVLVYSIHYLLTNVVKKYPFGSFDSSLGMLASIFLEDLFGVLDEERMADELRGKMIEMKSSKSYDSFELISSTISLSKISALMNPMKEMLLSSTSSKVITKIKEILRRIAIGIGNNSSIRCDQLMTFIHGLMTENLSFFKVEIAKGKELDVNDNFKVQLRRNDPIQEALFLFQANVHVFIEFGFSLLLSAIKRGQVDIKNDQHLGFLDPLVEILTKALYAKHTNVSILSMRIYALILKAPLPSFDRAIPILIKRVFEIISRNQSSKSEALQGALKLLATVVRDCKFIDISQDQLILTVNLISPMLEEGEANATIFSLIRAILSKKYVFNELYDLMTIVSRIMITSQSSQIRELCGQCVLAFILEYPHGNISVQKQMSYLLNNLNYPFESGRLSVLHLLRTLIEKFSDEVFSEYTEVVFLALTMSLVNDESSSCRAFCAKVITTLIRRLTVNHRDRILEILAGWYRSPQTALQRVAAQVYGFFFEAGDDLPSKVCAQFLTSVEVPLSGLHGEFSSAHGANDGDENDGELKWEVGYVTINSLEKFFKAYPKYLFSDESTKLWPLLKTALSHRHAWVASVAIRLFGRLFKAYNVEIETGRVTAGTAASARLLPGDFVSSVAQSIATHLTSPHLSDTQAVDVASTLDVAGRYIVHANEKDAESTDDTTRRILFQWFGAMTSVVKKDHEREGRSSNEGKRYLTKAEQVKQAAKEVLEVLHRHVGTHVFINIRQEVESKMKDIRADRQEKRKIETVVDTERAVRRKTANRELKKITKKRKNEEHAERSGKWKRKRLDG